MAAILVDTNVLVYAYDPRDATKNAQAQFLLKTLYQQKAGYLSAQSLAEFMNASRKLTISPADALTYAQAFAASWPVIDVTVQVVLEAGRGVRDHQFSFYDAQIWAAARLSQIPVILSEDFNSGSTLEGVRFVNPFAASFNIANWI